MTLEEILRDALRLLDKLGIEYMLTGSFASNVHGRVRSTFDADIVVVLKPAQLKMLIDSLGADYYVDNMTLPEVQESGGKLNALHRPSGLKIDFFLARTARDREAQDDPVRRRRDRRHRSRGFDPREAPLGQGGRLCPAGRGRARHRRGHARQA